VGRAVHARAMPLPVRRAGRWLYATP
jgi:hypothetical protein